MDAGAPAPEEEEEVEHPRYREDGSPLLPLPRSRPGFVVTEGEHEGIYYFEAVIGEVSPDGPLPTVVVLHGRDGRAEPPGGPFHGLTHPVRVIVPQAPDPLRRGFQWIPVYVNQGLVDELAATLFRAASRVAHLIREITRQRGVVGRPIVTGFSQGGIMTMALALYHDDVVGTAFPISGWLPPPLEPAYRRPDLVYPQIRAMHGSADDTVPIDPTIALFGRLEAMGFDAELDVIEGVAHTTTAQMNDVFHEWLEGAVCRTVGDLECAMNADIRAAEMLGKPVDAGLVAGDAYARDAYARDADAGDADAGDADAGDADAGDADAGTDTGMGAPHSID